MEELPLTPDQKNEAIRDRYVPIMAPAFFPDEPNNPDVIQLLASLLRVVGMEDKGWDPYSESRALIDDLYALMQFESCLSGYHPHPLYVVCTHFPE